MFCLKFQNHYTFVESIYEVRLILRLKQGSNKIQGIMLRSPEPIKVSLKSKVFKRMKNLKFMIGDVHIDKELDYLPHELRFLE